MRQRPQQHPCRRGGRDVGRGFATRRGRPWARGPAAVARRPLRVQSGASLGANVDPERVIRDATEEAHGLAEAC